MKKYLMTGIAAVAMATTFTSCSHDFEPMTQGKIAQAKYEAAFIKAFGQPSADQDWGFGSVNKARTRAGGNSSTNATLFSDWSDTKTSITVTEATGTLYGKAGEKADALKNYLEVLPESANNTSKIASTNKEEFITTEAGEISYLVIDGVTAGTNDRIGYYYYTNSTNIKSLQKYVISNDPTGLVNEDQSDSYDVYTDNNGTSTYQYTATGRHYKKITLYYYDENGNQSTTFPAGVNVGFFIQTDIRKKDGSYQTVELYSKGSLNGEISEWLGENSNYDTSWTTQGTTNSHVAIFSNNGYNYVGFEDWTDYDYNDIVLSVVGNIRPTETTEINNEVTADVRIIAEDLSATEASDFDFNDVVFDVKYTSETEADLYLQAAGGTLPLTVAGKEVHEWFGVGTKTMVNTRKAGAVSKPVPAKYHVTGINKDLKGKDIVIKVNKGTDEEPSWQELQAKQGVPAAKLAVSADFKWCDERVSIEEAYPIFSEWVSKPSLIWY